MLKKSSYSKYDKSGCSSDFKLEKLKKRKKIKPSKSIMKITDKNINNARRYYNDLSDFIYDYDVGENLEETFIQGNINIENLKKEQSEILKAIKEYDVIVKSQDLEVDTYYRDDTNKCYNEITYIHIVDLDKKNGIIKTESIKINKKYGTVEPNFKNQSDYYSRYTLDNIRYGIIRNDIVKIEKDVWDKLKNLIKNIKKYLK